MSKKKLSKLLALYLPYVVIGLLATNLGEAWRLAVGKELGDKIVSLMDTELSELQAELPDKWEYYIDRLSGYIASTGRKYKNHAATIRRWVADDTAKAAPKRGIPDYSYKEGESL